MIDRKLFRLVALESPAAVGKLLGHELDETILKANVVRVKGGLDSGHRVYRTSG